ncbi:MAG TPA: DUF4339 domain-containing protein [Pirellulales bacterium]|jgi:hypothetical protein|nr:DUF4339 domain-containing protein [Pirellulales bacterium]
MAETQWYYARNDQQYGPVSAADLKQLAEAGQLSPNDLLWREGMDAWTTAVNLRGLFAEDAATPGSRPAPNLVEAVDRLQSPADKNHLPARAGGLRRQLRIVQMFLWSLCVLAVLLGVVLFTRAFLNSDNPNDEASAAIVCSAFCLAAYVLARSGEKLSRLVLARARRRG